LFNLKIIYIPSSQVVGRGAKEKVNAIHSAIKFPWKLTNTMRQASNEKPKDF